MSAEFVQLRLEQGATLELTPEHLVFMSGGTSVPALAVKIGNAILLDAGGASAVVGFKIVFRRGAYGPLTTSGTIVVNGVIDVPTCRWIQASPQGRTIRNSDYLALCGACATDIPPYDVQMYSSSFCQTETHNAEGSRLEIEMAAAKISRAKRRSAGVSLRLSGCVWH